MGDEYDAYLMWELSPQEQMNWLRASIRRLKEENDKLRRELARASEGIHD